MIFLLGEIAGVRLPMLRAAENALECEVSKVICAMPFLWLAINDEPGAESLRGYIERNSIALLSNFEKEASTEYRMAWAFLRSRVGAQIRPLEPKACR
jgi:hypothetical protein